MHLSKTHYFFPLLLKKFGFQFWTMNFSHSLEKSFCDHYSFSSYILLILFLNCIGYFKKIYCCSWVPDQYQKSLLHSRAFINHDKITLNDSGLHTSSLTFFCHCLCWSFRCINVFFVFRHELYFPSPLVWSYWHANCISCYQFHITFVNINFSFYFSFYRVNYQTLLWLCLDHRTWAEVMPFLGYYLSIKGGNGAG